MSQNPITPFVRKYQSAMQQLMLVVMFYSTVGAYSQHMIADYFHPGNSHFYKGSDLADPEIAAQTTLPLPAALPAKPTMGPKNITIQLPDYSPEIFEADIKQGVIGISDNNPIDDPRDNIFKFTITSFPENARAYLSYDLFGLENYQAVARSINQRISHGGLLVKKQASWSKQREEIDPQWLHAGENEVMFTIPEGADFQYTVKNIKVEFEHTGTMLPQLALNQSQPSIKGDKIYVSGFIRNNDVSPINIAIGNTNLVCNDGSFEGLVPMTEAMKTQKAIVVIASDKNGLLGQELMAFDKFTEADAVFANNPNIVQTAVAVAACKPAVVETNGASVSISADALRSDKTIKIMQLRPVDLPPLGAGLVNVTKNKIGYRFLPDGTKFDKPVSLSLEYDTKLLPTGYSVKDIRTYYFDKHSKSWIAVKRDSLDAKNNTLVSTTTHFTDYINGIIQAPESPGTTTYSPTSITDIKAADPAAEMTLINPPTANSKGEANISYPIKIPSGRQGMQPDINVQYSNSGGNSWLGQGWNITTPAITIDSRWGVPLCDPEKETEIYLLNGEQMMHPKIGEVNYMPNRHNDIGANLYNTDLRARTTPDKIFTMRKQGSFTKLERLGTGVTDYWWKVTSNDGMVYWYGGKEGADPNATIRNGDNAIVHWALYMVEDAHGNNIKYNYVNTVIPNQSGVHENLNQGHIFHVNKIFYTGYNNADGYYSVIFNTTNTIRNDVQINARSGAKMIEPYFLDNIEIRTSGQDPFRKYKFEMGTGIFGKGRLKAIAETDGVGNEFYRHTFDYYEDVKDPKEIFAQSVDVPVPNIHADFSLDMGNLLNASRLNSSQTEEYSWNGRVSVGLQLLWVDNDDHNMFTIGVPFGESYSTNKAKIAMADMNGDGLDDVLYKDGGSLYYYPHVITASATDSIHSFDSTPRRIININNFSKTQGKTTHKLFEGVDFNFWGFTAGRKRSVSKEETSIYITDGNGDMLPDIVNDDKVYFNTGLNQNDENVFETGSNNTPNMLITAETVEVVPQPGEVEAIQDSDDYNYDVVRVWQAPYKMVVKITDDLTFLPSSSSSRAVYSIETCDPKSPTNSPYRIYLIKFDNSHTTESVSLTAPIPAPTTPLGLPVAPTNLVLEQGQRLYFRLKRNKAAANDPLISNPTIELAQPTSPVPFDQNGLNIEKYNYKTDYILSESQEVEVFGGTVNITWPIINVPSPTDDVTYKVLKDTRQGNTTNAVELYSGTVSMGSSSTAALPANSITDNIATLPAGTKVVYRFVVNSGSNINWSTSQWLPKVAYTPNAAAIADGRLAFSRQAVPKYAIYQQVGINTFELKAHTNPVNLITWQPDATATTYTVQPNTYYPAGANALTSNDHGSFRFVVKVDNVFVGRCEVLIDGTTISVNGGPIQIYSGIVNPSNPPKVSCEFYVDGAKNLALFERYTKAVYAPASYSPFSVDEGRGNVVLSKASESSHPLSDQTHHFRFCFSALHNKYNYMGPMNRGWGQFMYNASLDEDTNIPSDAIYGKLINPAIVENFTDNATQLINDGPNIDGCQSLPQDQIEGCVTSAVTNAYPIPAEGTTINAGNVESVVAGIGTMNVSLWKKMMCLYQMHAIRYYDHNERFEKWIGFSDNQYSAPREMKAGDMLSSQIANAFNDPTNPETESTFLPGDEDTGMGAITKVQRSASISHQAGWGSAIYSNSESSYSNRDSDFIDLNGDRYPDAITSTDSQLTTMTGGHQAPSGEYGTLPVNSNDSSNESISLAGQIPVSGRKKVSEINNDTGTPSFSMGINANLSGSNRDRQTLADLNGDGLPDSVTFDGSIYKYQLNTGKPFNQGGASYPFANYDGMTTKPSSVDASLGFSFGNQYDSGFGFSVSAGLSETGGKTTLTFQDINGDGLDDELTFSENSAYVRYNMGNHFSANNQELAIANLYNTNSSVSASLSGLVSYYFGFSVCCWILPIVYIKIGAGVGGSANLTVAQTNREFRDFNGDGYPDYVEKNGTNLKVNLSMIKRTDMLKSVTNPLGGQFTINYSPKLTDFSDPTSHWVMSHLEVEAGYLYSPLGTTTYKKDFVYENGRYDRREREFAGFGTVKTIDSDYNSDAAENYRKTIDLYHNTNYFLNGLLQQTSLVNGTDESIVYTKTTNTYVLRELDSETNEVLSGQSVPDLPLDFDTGGREGRRTAAVLLKSTRVDKVVPSNFAIETLFDYYPNGQISQYTVNNLANTANSYTTEVSYHSAASLLNKNMTGIPKTVTVKDASQNIYRQRSTEVNENTGDVLQIIASDGTTDSVTDMKYDEYGNQIYIEYPEDANNMRFTMEYGYDLETFKYVEATMDGYGYQSAADYNPRFDKVVSAQDIAGNLMTYKYDNFGRTTHVVGPKEAAASLPYTIKFDYYTKQSQLPATANVDPEDFVPVAVTKHYDVQHPGNDIETCTFVDGLDRVIQIKKDILYHATGNEEMSVSGLVTYDGVARPIRQFLPVHEPKADVNQYRLNTTQVNDYTDTKYDIQDRVIKVTDPEGHPSDIEYLLSMTPTNSQVGMRIRNKTAQNSATYITSDTYQDVDGKTLETVALGGNDINTVFAYNPIGELTGATDEDGLTTTYTYDKLGRKLSVTHPDRGLTSYQYDKAGNMTQLQTANLLSDSSLSAADQFIKYEYFFNRVKTIKYPVRNGIENLSNVYYQYGETGNETGRVICRSDAVGSQIYKYDNMGNISYDQRLVTGPNIPDRLFTTYFEYDSWNRLQRLTYPDGEVLDHYYDLGGNLTKMTGGPLSPNTTAQYDYLKEIDYDEYEQRTFMEYGNKTTTYYEYEDTLRRLEKLRTLSSVPTIMFDNIYQYDYVGNVTRLDNVAPASGIGGSTSHNYAYDAFNRLRQAEGAFNGDPAQAALNNDVTANYALTMEYEGAGRILNKKQTHSRNGIAATANSYDSDYDYFPGTHQIKNVTDATSATSFEYDLNGNTKARQKTGMAERHYYWDESDRLRVMSQKYFMEHYIYDASGERVLKAETDIEEVYSDGELVSPGTATILGYTTYPSAYMTIDLGGKYTKHYFAGSQRIASAIGTRKPIAFFEEINEQDRTAHSCRPKTGGSEGTSEELKVLQKTDLQRILNDAGQDNPVFEDYVDYSTTPEEEENTIGQGEGGTPQAAAAAPGNDIQLYFYHPDHLGSSTILTDAAGKPYQFFANLPFGETMAEQLPTSYYATPYKFNGKELDESTGLYYYGARYYDPVVSGWLSVDPLAEKYAAWTPYNYTLQNPVNMVDPDGRAPYDWYRDKNGIVRFDIKVKNQADVEKISPGGKYIASEFSTKTANYYKDGGAFFKNEHEGYKFMIQNSNMQRGKNETEHVGYITNSGVAVLPKEGKDMWGDDFKNTSLHSELNVEGYLWMGTGKNLTVNFHGMKLKPIAWVHTHPDYFGGYGQSAGDTGATRTLGIPSIIIGRDFIYGQSVRDASRNFGGSEVMTRDQLEKEYFPIISNIKLLSK